MKHIVWKLASLILLVYTLIGGLLMGVPKVDILYESIRNLYFHVPMWFAMTFLLLCSMIFSIRYLNKGRIQDDFWASSFATSAILFGALGCATGMLWAKFTWGDFWPNDPKLNGAAIGMLMYAAYHILRGSLKDEAQRGKVSAVYNVFAFPLFIAMIYVMPRLTESLHPGNGGNPGFSTYDLDDKMRRIFYPGVIGWILLSWWITEIQVRIKKLKLRKDEKDITEPFTDSI